MTVTTKKVNQLTNVGNLQDGDVFVGERVNGTTVRITFNNVAIDHNALNNYVANEHIDWTSTSENFSTSGTLASGAQTVTGNIVVSGTVDGRDVASDGTKLDGIEANADVTDETNVTSSLDGATLTAATVANGDKVLVQDVDASDALKTATALSIRDLTPTAGFTGTDAEVRANAPTFTGLATFDSGINLGADDLTDYEEGEWTPGLEGDTVTGSPAGTIIGSYERIGSQVTLRGQIALTSLGGLEGNVSISGFPFAISNNNKYRASLIIGFRTGFTNDFVIAGFADKNTTKVSLYNAELDNTTVDHTDCSDSLNIIFTISYRTG